MVEGPGATRNARKLQPCIGSTVTECSIDAHRDGVGNKQVVVDAFGVGKEVFMVLSDDSSLRLHFGMNGCLWLSHKSFSQQSATRNTSSDIALKMTFQDANNNNNVWILTCRGTTVTAVTARVAYSKRNRLLKRDVCAEDDVFDALEVMNALKTRRPTALIADAVLDQDRFPGVGNIIKVEGLHQANIHPKRTIASLSDEELQSVVTECRLYARQWLKAGRAPAKLVYNQTTCQSCQGMVRMAKLGNDLSRTTFWCPACQPHDTVVVAGQKRNATCAIETPAPKVARRATLNPIGACPQHGVRSIQMKRVRKAGRNQNRLFYGCKQKSCPYFAWADVHLRTCCGRKVLLRVSKTERTGGKWFTSCPSCSFFAWATPQQLAPIQKHLTPLL